MAELTTSESAAMTALTIDEPRELPMPITQTCRQIGAEAAAEQRELIALLHERDDSLSGFAKRGIQMRIRVLSDLMSDLFDGTYETWVLADTLYGLGEKGSGVLEALRVELEASHV